MGPLAFDVRAKRYQALTYDLVHGDSVGTDPPLPGIGP
jgi:hypothetical protein